MYNVTTKVATERETTQRQNEFNNQTKDPQGDFQLSFSRCRNQRESLQVWRVQPDTPAKAQDLVKIQVITNTVGHDNKSYTYIIYIPPLTHHHKSGRGFSESVVVPSHILHSSW